MCRLQRVGNVGTRCQMQRELCIAEPVNMIVPLFDCNTDVSVPVVCVVVEGGPNTIATVYEAIMNGTPAVIVSGTGRAADILAFAFQRAPLVEKLVKDSKGNIKRE